MSDEERYVDIESDEEEDGTLETGNATQFMTPAEKRAHHNALERKRRDHIKESFNGLRDCIPNLSGDKVHASRAQILKQATEYIQFMSKKNGSIQSDIDDLKRQNHVLESQVRGLEKAKTTGAFAQSTFGGAGPAGYEGPDILDEYDDDEEEDEQEQVELPIEEAHSDAESSDSELQLHQSKRKKLKTSHK